MAKNPLKIVMIRRGSSTVENVPSQNLITFIRKKVLLGTDELSGDGKDWIRVDRHYQLRKFFAINEGDPSKMEVGGTPRFEDKSEEGELLPPPGFTGNLEEVAGLLKDINGREQ